MRTHYAMLLQPPTPGPLPMHTEKCDFFCFCFVTVTKSCLEQPAVPGYPVTRKWRLLDDNLVCLDQPAVHGYPRDQQVEAAGR